jgi:hypothetical protein
LISTYGAWFYLVLKTLTNHIKQPGASSLRFCQTGWEIKKKNHSVNLNLDKSLVLIKPYIAELALGTTVFIILRMTASLEVLLLVPP